PVFVSGIGELADLGDVKGELALLGEDPAALAVATEGGPLVTSLAPQTTAHVGTPKIVRMAAAPLGAARRKSSLLVSLAPKTQALFGAMWTAASTKLARVQGVVRG